MAFKGRTGKWWAGSNDEFFTEGPLDSRDDAIAEGRGQFGEDGFYICEAEQQPFSLDAQRLLDSQYFEQDDLFDYDHSEPGRKGDHAAADAELQALLNAWCDKHRDTFITPSLFLWSANHEHIPAQVDTGPKGGDPLGAPALPGSAVAEGDAPNG